ncbi:MAG: carbonic anhydrase [Paludibacter sp.]|nr:carbonic anhydrase [Paludibacter sp.]
MQYLFDGVKDFHANDYLEMKKHFRKIGKSQQPHTLFIGCSDSRIVPNLITKTLPGELFVIRNIANLVPVYRESQEYLATTSAIEYSVKVLNIDNIIICGHSNCGGCKAIFMNEKETAEIPHTRKWLELMGRVKEMVLEKEGHNHASRGGSEAEEAKRELMTEQLNIVEQMNHLLSYPYIRERYEKGSINILGWYYIIETGEVFNYDVEKQVFVKIE